MSPRWCRLLVRLGLLAPDRLRVPLEEDSLRIGAKLQVETASGGRESINFRVDSGATISTMSLALAEQVGLSTRGRRRSFWFETGAGRISVDVILGEFRFWLSADQRAAAFAAPIHFRLDQPESAPAILGLEGVITQLSWTIDGRFRIDEPHGVCVLEDIRPAAQRFP